MKNQDILEEIRNPQKSIFVSANAGSGKTFILVARVLNLMLSGEDSSKILCISFTEAAAKEILERISTILLKWQKLENLEEDLILKNAPSSFLKKAKTLYTEVVLANKMPKIKTFHGFCVDVINAFLVETNVFYRPKILTNSAEKLIKKDLIKQLFFEDKTREKLEEIKTVFSNFTIEENLLPAILNIRNESFFLQKEAYLQPYKTLNTEYFKESLTKKLEQLKEDFIKNIDFKELETMIFYAKNGSTEDVKFATNITNFIKTKNFNFLKSSFLTTSETKKSRILTKKTLNEAKFLLYSTESLAEKLEIFCKQINIAKCAKITESFIFLISEVVKKYEEIKKIKEVLDFEDLILKTKLALESEHKDFILFKLDGGINHILVDEAQDTNFLQWKILFCILEEFFAGFGSQRGNKSLFIVGDEKQSIFSFQGSEPEVLNYILEKYKINLEQFFLTKSYRTSPILLEFIDEIFTKIPEFKNYSKHISAKLDLPAKIEIIDYLESENENLKNEKIEWQMPWKQQNIKNAKLIIANQIYEKILQVLEQNTSLKPCNIMLLAKNRDFKIFKILKEKLRNNGIGISFGDEIKISESLPLKDFIYLLKALIFSQDSYAIACVLRSPLFALNEHEIEEIFLYKTKNLPEKFTVLKSFLHYSLEEFFNKMISIFYENYTENELKEILQIFNFIQEFKEYYEVINFENFIQFCETLEKFNINFKLELPECENNIKINTVHGSKGLESEVVFIINSSVVFSKQAEKEYFFYDKNFSNILLAKTSMNIEPWKHLKQKKKEKEYSEYLRLFYVALTRAKSELYIFGNEVKNEEYLSWFELAKANCKQNNLHCNSKNQVQVSEISVQNSIKNKNKIIIESINNFEKPIFIKATQNIKLETKNIQAGSIIHKFLENEITNKNEDFFINFIAKKYPDFEKNEIINLINISYKIKTCFPDLFKISTLSEVEIVLEIEKNKILKCKIDKLIIENNTISIIDFKMHREEKLTPEILKQLKQYSFAISKIYQNFQIKTFVLWLNSLTLESVLLE